MRLPLPLIVVAALLGPLSGVGGAQEGVVDAGPAAEPVVVEERVPMLVELVDMGVPGDAPAIAALLDLAHEGIQSTGVVGELDLMAADVSPEGLAALQSSSAVEAVRPARQDLQLLLDESAATIGAAELHARGLTGEGRVVAVIDSGVDVDHPALVGSVVAQGCFLDGVPTFSNQPAVSVTELCENGTRNDTSAEPCVTIPQSCTHGTAVAGVVTGDDETYTGIAPDAGIIALRVGAVVEGLADEGDPEFPYRTYIPEAGVLAALEAVYSLRDTYDIAAVNLSLGGPPGDCVSAAWEDIVDRLAGAGIAVVAASGNQGWAGSLTFPACLAGVVSVGASTSDGEVAPFSNTGPDLDLLAPGSPITTTALTSHDPSGFATQQGTSFSSPHVAAAFALVDSSLPSGWSVERVRNLLRVSGSMIERPTPSPFDRDPRYPELRLASLVDFEPFGDADEGYWVEAADWAKATGVSTGIGGNRFDPDGALTRAQAVTFLWRFMGAPDAGTASGFADVAADQWYAAAVTWAAATGVTTGTAPGVFSPDAPVSRGQLATFMWRTAGQPPPSIGSGFRDVAAGAFYDTAVDWMAEHGLTTGTTASTFSPDDEVTRAQMVTFEFRLADAGDAWIGAVAPPELALF
ncbi:MAG: S8 family serine peptidase [Acidimicrobiales bacterium]